MVPRDYFFGTNFCTQPPDLLTAHPVVRPA